MSECNRRLGRLSISDISYEQAQKICDSEFSSILWLNGKAYPTDNIECVWEDNLMLASCPDVSSEPVAQLITDTDGTSRVLKGYAPKAWNERIKCEPLYTHPAPVASDRVAELEAKLKVAREAIQDFINKVDRGEARSVKSYAKFTEALKQIGEV